MAPDEIFAAMAEAYATCNSYRDTGTVVTRYVGLDAATNRTSVTRFKTAFSREGWFRFEFESEALKCGRFAVWSDGERAWTWNAAQPWACEAESLGLALAGATGISSGSAHTVPVLLLPGVVSGLRLYDNLAEAAWGGDEEVEGTACHLVALRYQEDPNAFERLRRSLPNATAERLERWTRAPTLVWIDQETYLIRMTKDATQWETFGGETVTTYDPEFGVPIGEDELWFDPPGDGR